MIVEFGLGVHLLDDDWVLVMRRIGFGVNRVEVLLLVRHVLRMARCIFYFLYGWRCILNDSV